MPEWCKSANLYLLDEFGLGGASDVVDARLSQRGPFRKVPDVVADELAVERLQLVSWKAKKM
jgi:hypothetical protein